MANDGDDDSATPVGDANSDPHTSEVKSAEEPDSESSSDLEAQISSPSPQLSFDLASNAYDFLNESLNNAERASTGEPIIWKFAIANIAQAIELLLKERLRREHFLLVYADIDRKRRTVNVDQALDRLSNCDVILDKEDVVRLKRARDVRNEIVHFTIIVNEEQLRATYTDLFEFAHIFHVNALGEELHAHIDDHLWEAEAALMADFRRKFVTYQGAEIVKEFPSEILDSQFIISYRIDGKDYTRIRWRARSPDPEYRNCHDCGVIPGQLHTPDCDMEECPKCGGQWITCECVAEEYEYVEEIDQWVKQD